MKKIEDEDKQLDEMNRVQNDRLAKHGNYIRSVDQFMADQMSFEQRKVLKIQEAAHRQELMNLQPHHPVINENSRKIIDDRRKESAISSSSPKLETSYGRNDKIRVRQNQYELEKQQELRFSPEISRKSKMLQGRGLEYLTKEDVPKWQQKQRMIQSAKNRDSPVRYQINQTSDKLIHDRFEVEFDEACKVLTHSPDGINLRNEQISCSSMSQLMLRLGFVSRSLHQEEQLALAEIWRRIGGDSEGQGTVPLGNLKNKLRAIQNFHHQEILDVEREQDPEVFKISKKAIGRHTQNGLLFTSDEIEQITRNYRFLYKNRLDKIAEDKSKQIYNKIGQEAMKQETHHPELLKKSQALGDRRNSKFAPSGAGMSPRIEDRLFAKANYSAAMKEHLKRENDAKIAKETPFQPKIRHLHSVKHQEAIQHYPNEWEYLHEVGKQHKLKKTEDVPTDIYEYNKQKDEYTFSPNKHKQNGPIERRNTYMQPLQRQLENEKTTSPRKSLKKAGTGLNENEHFLINVNVGSETRTILATLKSDPHDLAQSFLKVNGFDMKYAKTLEKAIAQHQENLNLN